MLLHTSEEDIDPERIPLVGDVSRPSAADTVQHDRDVRFVPKADKCSAAYPPAYWWLILTQLVERLEY